MKRFSLIGAFILCTSLGLVGCNNSGSKAEELKPASLFEGLTFLTTTKNYTIDRFSNNNVVASYVFTENSIGQYNPKFMENTDFYVVSGDGLYEVNYADEFVRSEFILDSNGEQITDLWNNEYVANLYGIDISDITTDRTATNFDIKSRNFKLNFMQAVGFDSLDYLDVESLNANFTIAGCVELRLKFFENPVSYVYKVRDIGTSVNKIADNYVNKNTPASTVNDELSAVRRLIKGDNFRIISYDIIEEEYYAEEWLTNKYWFSTYLYYGYFAARHHQTSAEDQEVSGCYMFQYQDGHIQLLNTMVSTMTDITEFEHYPSRAKLWNKMHFIKEGYYGTSKKDYKYEGNSAYYIDNYDLVLDMIELYSLDPAHSSESSIFSFAKPKALLLDLNVTKNGRVMSDADCEITFVYVFEYQSKKYYMPLPMYDFGNVSIPALDEYLTEFNNY